MVKTPWNRNRNRPSTAKVPAEVEEYYQSTRKERAGVAWLLAFATLLLTLLIAAGLFFGGRWLYRTVFSNNDDTQQVQVDEADNGAEQAPAEPANPDNGQQQSGSSSDAPATPSTEAPANSGTNNTQQTPTTGPETPEIPHTGPTSNE